MNILSAIEQALNALELLNNGYKCNEHNSADPLRQAEDRIKWFVPRTEWTRPTEDDDKNKLATATKMIREITGSAAPPSTRCPVDVKLCDYSKGSVNPISETLEYSFTGDSYTLDDLLYILRLRRPNFITRSPFLYCRQVGGHLYTHEGSMFKRRNSWEPLKGLSRTGLDGIGVVYLVAPEPKFVLLVKGVPWKEGEKDKDGFYIVHTKAKPGRSITFQEPSRATRATQVGLPGLPGGNIRVGNSSHGMKENGSSAFRGRKKSNRQMSESLQPHFQVHLYLHAGDYCFTSQHCTLG
ncbi:hypothetical protein M407DRAFT_8862 [Tulasnella calospora MUT 4182]|uniref:Uncharacterized protein n=1 Tax=Tulasnella calospora MUT 4182 TaxID=1051891 RepID=A0A0C3LT81_9AGAM|nr:hypothetical protein M407DRAFT_8862 [Tulasnella calospora MUT 4182]